MEMIKKEKNIKILNKLLFIWLLFIVACRPSWKEGFTPAEKKIITLLETKDHVEFAEILDETVDFYTYSWGEKFMKSKDLQKFLAKESVFYQYLFDFKKAEPEIDLSHSDRYISFQDLIAKCSVDLSCGSEIYKGELGPNVRTIFFGYRYPDGVGTSNTIFIKCKNPSNCKIIKFEIQ